MAQLIKVDGTIQDVEPKNGKDFSLGELQSFVGGFIEICYMKNTRILVINEEGRINGLRINRKATGILRQDLGREVIPIVGDVLLCEKHQVL